MNVQENNDEPSRMPRVLRRRQQHNGAAFAACSPRMGLSQFYGGVRRPCEDRGDDDEVLSHADDFRWTCTIVRMAKHSMQYTFSYRRNCPKQKALAYFEVSRS